MKGVFFLYEFGLEIAFPTLLFAEITTNILTELLLYPEINYNCFVYLPSENLLWFKLPDPHQESPPLGLGAPVHAVLTGLFSSHVVSRLKLLTASAATDFLKNLFLSLFRSWMINCLSGQRSFLYLSVLLKSPQDTISAWDKS